jgi:hypothetical protein
MTTFINILYYLVFNMISWKEFLNEGALTNYRTEKEGKKLTYNNFKDTFETILCKLIDERIPFWFDCQGIGGEVKDCTKLGYLMNESINGQSFNGYILDSTKTTEQIKSFLSSKVLPNIIVEKPGKLYIGRSAYSDLTKATDLDTITVVVKAFKNYYKDKGLTSREISGNKYETKVNIDFLCDLNTVNNIIDFVF